MIAFAFCQTVSCAEIATGRTGRKIMPESKYGTGYLESEMVLAARAGDWEEVDRLVNEMLPQEARNLRRALSEVSIYLEFRGRNGNAHNSG